MKKNTKLNLYFLAAVIILVGIAVFKIFLPFLATLLTAFIFWQLFGPTYKFLAKKLRNDRLASLLSCIIVFLVIVLPFFIVGSIATNEALNIYNNLTTDNINELQENVKSIIYNYSQRIGISQYNLEQYFASVDLGETTKKLAGISAGFLQQAYQQVSQFIFLVFVMLFTLYYLFLDGEKFIKYIFHISPLREKEESLIWNRFLSMSRATIKGTLIIGIIQGILGGLSFWILGINSSAFWGVIMGIFSVLPLIGPVVVWVPAAIWLFVTGAWIKGLIMVIIGSMVIGSADNFLRPKLIGKDTALHPVLILVGTFGGIIEFGIMGFIIGPLILTIFTALLEIFERKFQKELE